MKMTEDHQSCLLPPGDINFLGSIANNEIASGCNDFNKYDRYVERIRTLFVPSLEPRIHSCLETFVYRRESGPSSDPPYLKRCLDAAATLRDPVEAFCTKWRDSGFVETMLATVVKFLISNGPIDCFLNSIILNNRLNKVCRDLDALGVEKDLLRYLAVWNYINERDYWLEEDKLISTSKSDESRDSIDRRSDLDVEVGSGLDSRRNDRSIRRAFKRRATDDSSDDQDRSVRGLQHFQDNGQTRVPFPSRLSIDSSNPEGSRSSSARKKIRSCQTHPCRPATCPTYRAKNPTPVNWDRKTLKLQLCRSSLVSLDRRREYRRSSELSELDLPCKFDDLIAEIVKAHPISSRRFFGQGRKKFKAGATSVCSRVNETLGKIDGKEVARCRLHCEILPGCVSFRLIERDRDGSEVCLFSDRVPLDKVPIDKVGIDQVPIDQVPIDQVPIDQVPIDQVPIDKVPIDQVPIDKVPIDKVPIDKVPIDKVPIDKVPIDKVPIDKVPIDKVPIDKVPIDKVPIDKVEAPQCAPRSSGNEPRQTGEQKNADGAELTIYKNSGFSPADDESRIVGSLEETAIKTEPEDILLRLSDVDLEATARKNVEQLIEQGRRDASNRSSEDKAGEPMCGCDTSFDDEAACRRKEDNEDEGSGTKSHPQERSLDRSSGNAIADDRRDGDDKLDRTAKNEVNRNNVEGLARGESMLWNENLTEGQKCTCSVSSDFTADHLERAVEADLMQANRQAVIVDSHEEIADSAPGDRRAKLRRTLTSSFSLKIYQPDVPTDNQQEKIACECPSDCTCPNRGVEENRAEECQSKCSCESCRSEDEQRVLKKTEIIRMSSLLKPRTETLDSAVQSSSDPNSTQKSGALVPASEELQRDNTEENQSEQCDSQCSCDTCRREDEPRALKKTEIIRMSSLLKRRTETLDSASDEFQCGCLKVQSSNFHPKSDRSNTAASTLKSDTPLEINATKTMSFIKAGLLRALPDRGSAAQRTSSATNKCPRNLSSKENPIVSPRHSLNDATKTMSFIEADSQRARQDRRSAAQQTSSAMNKYPRNLSSEENPILSARLVLNDATKTMSFIEADSQRARQDRGSAAQRTSSATIKCPRNLSSKEHPIVSHPLSLNDATKTMSFIEADSQRARQDRRSAAQRTSSAMNKYPRNLSSEENPILSARLVLNDATKTMSFIEADSQRARQDRGSAAQQTSSATNKCPRNLSSEENPIVSARLSLNNATKTMSFIDADSQRAQPDRGSAVQRTSSAKNKSLRNLSSEKHSTVSARLPLKKYPPDVPTYLDKIACACPSDCTCPNRGTEENQPEECDSQCACATCRKDKSKPLKKTEIIRMSSLLRSQKTLDSVQDSPDPASTLKSAPFLVSAIDESQRGCTEVQTRRFHSQDLEDHEGPSMNADSPLDSNTAKAKAFIEAESPPAKPDRESAVRRTSSATNKTRRNTSSEEHPIAASRLSKPKGQRINISIEVCPESESSSEPTRRNERQSANDEFQIRQDATSLRKSRRHSVEPQAFEKQGLLHPGKDTRDELLGQPRLTDAGTPPPPRPLEFQDYLSPFRPPSSMRNPIVYGTSTRSARRSIGEMDRQSASQGGRRRGDSCVTKNRHGSSPQKDCLDEDEIPKKGLRTNVGYALSASSVDRMKHLIRTKLRRMLLERDKATNTPKTTLTNKKYRVSVPGAKNDRSPFGQQPCRTIWESRSASDSVRTSRSFASDDCKSPAGTEHEEARKHFRSTGNPWIASSRSRDWGETHRRNGVNSSRNSETGRRFAGNHRAPEVDSRTNFPRLAGGSDFCSKMKRHENMHASEKRGYEGVLQNKNGDFDEKFMNRRLKELPEETRDSSAGNSCDASGEKIPDECGKFHGILGAVGNERAPEVDSRTNFARLAGGSDFCSKMKRHENMHASEKRGYEGVLQNKNGGFDEKFINQRLKELPVKIGVSSATNSCNASDKKIPDECAKFHGILRVVGNEGAPEVDSETNFPRLAEGSDFVSTMKRHENMHSPGKSENRCALQNKKTGIDIIDEKCTNHSFKEVPVEIGDSSTRKACDMSGKQILDEPSEFYGKLDWSGNSTSRHIYLFEFDRLCSSNDETESADCYCSPQKTPEVPRTSRRNFDARSKKLIVSQRRESRSFRGRSAPRAKSAMSDCSSNMNNVSSSGIRRIGVFANIDQDLRKKLSQYVSLCKNVKYALLKRLRPDDIYEVSRTSIPCCDRYKFGDT